MTATGTKNVELARAIGVSKVAVTNWLNGSNSIDIEKVPVICDFFGVSVDAFLSHSSKVALDENEKRLVRLYRMADAKGQNAIMNAARHSLASSGPHTPSAPDREGF